ncbi:ExeA family protein [Ovoidimarina sediminis]|uniref:ExeA family protein n=1 Tax=Ovoidimarina sediminis TaxID=3079856 RepID=UPI00290EC965|nr:AAA family ATPase [Rhodophyticola sp. MJ-SS7]MDU8942575.1 AAA family ATPase [Rhodophyticola sp. MJ-SS7]
MNSDVGLYIEQFDLHERPFTLLPDPEFIYWTPMHRRAYSILEYGILTHAPITVVTGEVGAGKTTLVQKLLKSLPDDVTLGLISNAQGGRGELLRWVLYALDVDCEGATDYVDLFQILQSFLIEEYAAGRRCILIIDEAQNLSVEGLEELRMLTNVNSNKDELLQLVLVGQPELRETILLPELRQFAQRVVANFHLPGMDKETVAAYISHRLLVAGGRGNEFTKQACERVWEVSRGIPRLVNQICDFAMVYAATSDEKLVLSSVIDQVVSDGVFFAGYRGEEGNDDE